MSEEVTDFPLPHDVTDEERATARTEIGKHTRIIAEEPSRLRIEGRTIGQTGPIWHFQYIHTYRLPKGFMAAGHDLREGIKVFYADSAEALPKCFDHESVREFVEDELRFRGAIGSAHAPA